jgi:hypothetical protein
MDPHILAGVNTECPDDRYPKFNIDISKLILDSCEYITSILRNNALHYLSLTAYCSSLRGYRFLNYIF